MKKIYVCAFVIAFFLLAFGVAEASDTRAPDINVFKGSEKVGTFQAYSVSYKGGTNVAVGDINGDGLDEIVTGSGEGGQAHVRGFNQAGHFMGLSLFPFHKNYGGGVSVAIGDVYGGEENEIVVSQASRGQSWVKVYNPQNGAVLANFLAFDSDFKGGANVAVGDVDGDGKDEIVTGAGRGGGPQVRVYSGTGQFEGIGFFPFAEDFRGGVNVAVGQLDNSPAEEIIVSQASMGQAWVKAYQVNNSKENVITDFRAFNEDFKDGASVGAGDVDGDGFAEMIVGVGSNGGPQVLAYETDGRSTVANFFAYEDDFKGGVKVAAGRLAQTGRDYIVTGPSKFIWEGDKRFYEYIDVNLSEQTLTIYENGRRLKSYLVSTGIAAFLTPTGEFSIKDHIPSMRMTGFYGPGSPYNYDLPGVKWVMHVVGPITIHGAYWHNNFGHPMSHGCINMRDSEAKEVYDWAKVGTPVLIHY